MANTIVRFVNIILAALLAGTSFGIWIGMDPKGYSPATYIEQQQNLVQSLHSIMVSMVILATLVTLVSALLNKKNKFAFRALLLAAGCFFACIIISRFGNLPIQTEMLAWSPDQFPDNWMTQRDRWWSLHIVRTIAELVALILVAWTSVQKRK